MIPEAWNIHHDSCCHCCVNILQVGTGGVILLAKRNVRLKVKENDNNKTKT